MHDYTLVILKGLRQGERFPVTDTGLVLGRSSQCEIAIADLLLSRSHCRFEKRGDELWLVDLASANQTLVNGNPVAECRLNADDLITAGDSLLRVVRSAEATGAQADSTHRPDDVSIDLGFGKDERPHAGRKTALRPFLWAFAGLLILTCGITLILTPSRKEPAPHPMSLLPNTLKKPILIHYEKVEASTNNLFRYELSLSPDGLLAVKIDDLSEKERHVRKESPIDNERLAELTRDVEESGFFALEKSYTGFAATPNTLNEWTLTVAIGDKVHSCRVTNRSEPDTFRALREKLETFSKNELGIWAIQFSADKLTKLARDALAVAQKKYDERDVRYGNLFEALRSYQEAVFYLETVNPKPAFYTTIIEGFETTEDQLGKRYEEQRFRADRAINLSEWPNAARELKILCELIPDRSDPRHQEASRKLIDVENRLKKNRR